MKDFHNLTNGVSTLAKMPHPQITTLENILKEMDSVVVAYSGGVDSTLLAVAAHRALGDRALAVTAVSPALAARELEEATALAPSTAPEDAPWGGTVLSHHRPGRPRVELRQTIKAGRPRDYRWLGKSFLSEPHFSAATTG